MKGKKSHKKKAGKCKYPDRETIDRELKKINGEFLFIREINHITKVVQEIALDAYKKGEIDDVILSNVCVTFDFLDIAFIEQVKWNIENFKLSPAGERCLQKAMAELGLKKT